MSLSDACFWKENNAVEGGGIGDAVWNVAVVDAVTSLARAAELPILANVSMTEVVVAVILFSTISTSALRYKFSYPSFLKIYYTPMLHIFI